MTKPGTAPVSMNDVWALRYVLNFADTNTRVSTVMRTFTLPERETTRERLERLYAALSSPQSTVTEEMIEAGEAAYDREPEGDGAHRRALVKVYLAMHKVSKVSPLVPE